MESSSTIAERNALIHALRKFLLAQREAAPAVKVLLDRPFGQQLTLEGLRQLERSITAQHADWTLAELWTKLAGDDGSDSQALGLPEWISVVRFAMGQTPELKRFRQWSHQYLIEWLERNLARDVLFSEAQRAWLVYCADVFAEQLTLNLSDLASEQFRPIDGLARAEELFGANLEALITELNSELMG